MYVKFYVNISFIMTVCIYILTTSCTIMIDLSIQFECRLICS
jgi:hypothetical protein